MFVQVRRLALQKGDEFLLLACDGIWDVLTNQQVGRCDTSVADCHRLREISAPWGCRRGCRHERCIASLQAELLTALAASLQAVDCVRERRSAVHELIDVL